MKVNLKDNIWIEGFDNFRECVFAQDAYFDRLVYSGKTSEIPEETAKECVDCFKQKWYLDYGADIDYLFELETSKQSILSACDKPYCIIYKT